jgi:hypothetical protein
VSARCLVRVRKFRGQGRLNEDIIVPRAIMARETAHQRAVRMKHSDARRDTRAGHYDRGLQTKAGGLKVPKLLGPEEP